MCFLSPCPHKGIKCTHSLCGCHLCWVDWKFGLEKGMTPYGRLPAGFFLGHISPRGTQGLCALLSIAWKSRAPGSLMLLVGLHGSECLRCIPSWGVGVRGSGIQSSLSSEWKESFEQPG